MKKAKAPCEVALPCDLQVQVGREETVADWMLLLYGEFLFH